MEPGTSCMLSNPSIPELYPQPTRELILTDFEPHHSSARASTLEALWLTSCGQGCQRVLTESARWLEKPIQCDLLGMKLGIIQNKSS